MTDDIKMLPKKQMLHQPFRDPSLTQKPVFSSRLDGMVMTVAYSDHHPRGALIRHKAKQDLQQESRECGYA